MPSSFLLPGRGPQRAVMLKATRQEHPPCAPSRTSHPVSGRGSRRGSCRPSSHPSGPQRRTSPSSLSSSHTSSLLGLVGPTNPGAPSGRDPLPAPPSILVVREVGLGPRGGSQAASRRCRVCARRRCVSPSATPVDGFCGGHTKLRYVPGKSGMRTTKAAILAQAADGDGRPVGGRIGQRVFVSTGRLTGHFPEAIPQPISAPLHHSRSPVAPPAAAGSRHASAFSLLLRPLPLQRTLGKRVLPPDQPCPHQQGIRERCLAR